MHPQPGKYYKELENILEFWSTKAFDSKRDRFYGQLDNYNVPREDAELGAVLYSRILWSFSAGFSLTGNTRYLDMAGKSFNWLSHQFWDKECGGVYWTIDSAGNPANSRKQIYAQAFALYGFAEYYAAAKNAAALDFAIKLFNLIEQHSYDPLNKGYFEAFKRDWSEVDDLRLSEKDVNEKKSMNTHLHVLEAYTALYKIWPEPALKERLLELLSVFKQRIINPETGHLILFHNESWIAKSETVSYGHDIEASWLLREAAEAVQDESVKKDVEGLSIQLIQAAMEGVDNDGGLNYEYEPADNVFTKEKHWWVQAEAAVGFIAAWELTGDVKYLERFYATWNFIEKYLLDKVYGEWFWGVAENHTLMTGEDKAGLWKCPYHNSRCCIEIVRRTGCSPAVNHPISTVV